MTLFDLNHIGKIVFTKNSILNFCGICSHHICHKILKSAREQGELQKKLFTQTAADKISATMSRSQGKLERTRKL